jgi:hypothetical protein
MVTVVVDGWTSPNGHAFMAVVMRYVTNDWNLGMSRL